MGLFRFLLGAAVGATAAIVTGGASVVIGAAVGGTVTEIAGSMSDDEIAAKNRSEGYAQGVNDGTRAGNQVAAKKMATLLEKEDEVKTAIFALAISVANLDDKLCEYDKEAIYAYLGKPDSQVVSKKLQKEYNEIFERKPDFDTVKREYLDKIPGIDLKELDEIVREIIFDKEDKPSEEEKNFYDFQWVPYVNKAVRQKADIGNEEDLIATYTEIYKTMGIDALYTEGQAYAYGGSHVKDMQKAAEYYYLADRKSLEYTGYHHKKAQHSLEILEHNYYIKPMCKAFM